MYHPLYLFKTSVKNYRHPCILWAYYTLMKLKFTGLGLLALLIYQQTLKNRKDQP